MRKFLHIGINFGTRPVDVSELNPVLNKALDWIRYAPNCWVVLTSSESDVWYRRLKTVLHDQDSFLICELTIANGFPAGSGFLPASWWNWFKKYSDDGQLLEMPSFGDAPDSPPPPLSRLPPPRT